MQLINKIAEHAQQNGNQIALEFDGQRLTYQQLQVKIIEVSKQMTGLSVNQFVGISIKDPLDTMVYYLALLYKEHLPCLLDYRWSNEQVNQILKYYHIPYIIDEQHEVFATGYKQQRAYDFEQLQFLHIGFTSGTTGLPKAYYRDELSWIHSYFENEKLIPKSLTTVIAPGPLAHSLSLYACIYALYSGRTFIGQQNFNALTLMERVNNLQQNVALFLVPTMLASCLNVKKVLNKNHYIFSSGDKLSEHVRDKVDVSFPKSIIVEFFGTSEASFISYNYDNQAPAQSVGLPFDNVNIKLTQKDENNIGILNIKSDMVFSGYVDKGILQSSWISTGDFASIDKYGYLYLHGRANDRLIIGGRNVYPSEVEHVLQASEWFDEVLVIGQPHPTFGEVAILIYTSDKTITYRELKQYLSKHLARYKIPSKLKKITQFKHTASGKIARKAMKEWYLERSEYK
ncbi:AMP-binding protein [Staphylococcus sp. ACRSN]|uniref:AMP-binding protein n=1 Tax=Staphylococcus sp. ACRSN TaxID=2918214 RepID=UPI001EF18B5A|nr:AMP-binding protein [Staphylococcus sp. ACRSN]MCG7339305.1 AMP-binding protein [Staphylococcus sp. ACRSN]